MSGAVLGLVLPSTCAAVPSRCIFIVLQHAAAKFPQLLLELA